MTSAFCVVMTLAAPTADTGPGVALSAGGPERPACADGAGEAASQRLAGAFVRPDVGPSQDTAPWWSAADWQATFDSMRQICLDQIILQWTARTWAGPHPPPGVTDPNWPSERPPDCVTADSAGRFVQPLYPSSDPVWAANARRPLSGTCQPLTDRPIDQVGLALAAAKASGMTMWLGLQVDEPVWFDTGSTNPTWLLGPDYPDRVGGQALLSQRLARDLWSAYGPNGTLGDYQDTIAGFYLPFEANNQFFPPGSPQATNFGNYLGVVSRYIHELPDGHDLGVMTSPVQHAQIGASADDPTQQALRANWTDTLTEWLSQSEVTVVAPQSGTGMQWTSTADLGVWARAARDAVNRLPDGRNAGGTPVRLWANMEIYSIEGADNMPVDHLLRDMTATNSAGAEVDMFVAFSVRHLDDTPGHPGARRNSLYRSAYLHYLTTGRLPAQRVDPPAVLPDTLPATRLTAAPTSANGTTVSLQWQVVPSSGTHPDPEAPDVPVRPVAGYQVFRDGLPIAQVPQPLTDDEVDGFPAADTATNAGMTGFTDTNLQPGRSYRYQVASFDPFGNLSPMTDAATVHTPTNAGSATADGPGPADLAVHAAYAITDTTVDPSQLTDGSADPPPVADHLVRPNGTYPDLPATNALNDDATGTASHLDPAWSWHAASAGAYTMTIDLGRPQPVNTVRSVWLRDTSMGIGPPERVTLDYATAASPGDADWVRLNPDLAQTTAPADPGVAWLSNRLRPGHEVSARWLRLTVAAAPATSWTLVSEVQVYGADGTVNLALADERCAAARNCSTFVTARAARANRASSYSAAVMAAGHLTDGTPSSTTGPFVGWCFPESASCPTPSGTRPPGERFAITVDLGENQPIGSLSSTWLHQPDREFRLPPTIRYAYRTAGDGTHADEGWVDAGSVAADTPTETTQLADFTVTVPATGDAPTHARWLRAEVEVPDGSGWIAAGSVHAYAPAVVTPSQEQRPRIYTTGSTANTGYDPALPIHPDTNNPTSPHPPPPLPATPVVCSTAPDAHPCRGTDTVLESVLTGIDPTTNAPYRGQPDRWWEPDSHWLGLTGADGYDIVVPTTPADVPLIQLETRFLRSVNGAVGLPDSIDYYYTTTPDPTADPAAATWVWTRDTVIRPNLPPFLPDRTLLTWTYLSSAAGIPRHVTAIRIHINPAGRMPAFTDHTAIHGWTPNR